MSLREYTEEEIREELARRDKIRNSNWPKKLVLLFKPQDEDELGMFLDNECGFYEGSAKFDKIVESLEEVSLIVNIHEDARIEIFTEEELGPREASPDEFVEISADSI